MFLFSHHDFEREAGRKKIIRALKILDVRTRQLESALKKLADKETHLKDDIENIFKSE